MSTSRSFLGSFFCLVLFLGLCGISCIASAATTAPGASVQLTVKHKGAGAGRVISTPAGIDCPGRCTASFPKGTNVVLTPAPEPGTTFAGWSGPCTGVGTCKVTLGEATTGASTTVAPTFELGFATLQSSINHIIFLAQENRSMDSYFGALRQYWSLNGITDQSFDGLPQFNPTSGAPPLRGPKPALPGCNPNNPPPSDCIWDPSNPITSFRMTSVCNENTSPSWNEAHVDWNFNDQVGRYPAKNNGFVKTAGHDARTNPGHPFFDVNGRRAMGYWDGTELNVYYYLATKFGTSDRFFHPVLARTEPNRLFLVAGTSGGYALPNGSNANDTAQLKAKPIFAALQAAGISWKVYVDPFGTGCAGPPYQTSCLIKHSYLSGFTYAQTIVAQFPQHIAPISDYFKDLDNGTLPQVVEIAPASDHGLDEHGSVSDAQSRATNIQTGANFVRGLITYLMGSSSWSSSVFILTFDESGGMYDHVSPQPAVAPDANPAPVDIPPNSVCYTVKGPTCYFRFTGYRVPLLVVSPFAKQNYVSHTVADTTAILKLIETRFLPGTHLTARDNAQMDMTEFFNFNAPPWMSPPAVPAQNHSNPCYLDRVP